MIGKIALAATLAMFGATKINAETIGERADRHRRELIEGFLRDSIKADAEREKRAKEREEQIARMPKIQFDFDKRSWSEEHVRALEAEESGDPTAMTRFHKADSDYKFRQMVLNHGREKHRTTRAIQEAAIAKWDREHGYQEPKKWDDRGGSVWSNFWGKIDDRSDAKSKIEKIVYEGPFTAGGFLKPGRSVLEWKDEPLIDYDALFIDDEDRAKLEGWEDTLKAALDKEVYLELEEDAKVSLNALIPEEQKVRSFIAYWKDGHIILEPRKEEASDPDEGRYTPYGNRLLPES